MENVAMSERTFSVWPGSILPTFFETERMNCCTVLMAMSIIANSLFKLLKLAAFAYSGYAEFL